MAVEISDVHIMEEWERMMTHLDTHLTRGAGLCTLQTLVQQMHKTVEVLDARIRAEGERVLADERAGKDTTPPMGLTTGEEDDWHKGDLAGVRAALMAHDRRIADLADEVEKMKAWYSEGRR